MHFMNEEIMGVVLGGVVVLEVGLMVNMTMKPLSCTVAGPSLRA